MRRLRLVLCAAALGAPIVTLAVPAAAQAGSYTVYVCDPAHGNANNALSFSANISGNITSAAWCNGVGKSRGIQTWSTSGATPGAHAGAWWFHAPSGETVTHLGYSGDFSAFDGWVSHWATAMNGNGDPDPGADCPAANAGCKVSDGGVIGGSPVSTSVANATLLGFGIWCDAASCAQNDRRSTFGPAGSANVYAAQITVNDPGPPALSASGNLWGLSPSATIPGGSSWTLNFSASDPGGPCELDAVIDNGAGATVLSDADSVSPDYTLPAPCGAAGRGTTWQPNLASLPTGTYYLHVQSTDPAGLSSPDLVEQLNVDNTAPVTEPTIVHTDTVRRLRRSCHRTHGRHRRKHCSYVVLRARRGPLRLSFGQFGVVTGTASTAGGSPLASTPIDVYAHPQGWGSHLVDAIQTDANGNFAYVVPAGGPSRSLSFVFPGAGSLLSSAARVDVKVGGRGSLRLVGRLVAGRRALFEGRVLGGYVPAGGKLVQLRYRVGGSTSWSPFGPVVYTRRNGSWRVRIPIGASGLGLSYELDALLPAQAGWPYGRATSNVVIARVG